MANQHELAGKVHPAWMMSIHLDSLSKAASCRSLMHNQAGLLLVHDRGCPRATQTAANNRLFAACPSTWHTGTSRPVGSAGAGAGSGLLPPPLGPPPGMPPLARPGMAPPGFGGPLAPPPGARPRTCGSHNEAMCRELFTHRCIAAAHYQRLGSEHALLSVLWNDARGLEALSINAADWNLNAGIVRHVPWLHGGVPAQVRRQAWPLLRGRRRRPPSQAPLRSSRCHAHRRAFSLSCL